MKKIIALLLTFALMLSLCACGSQAPNAEDQPAKTESSGNAAIATEAPATEEDKSLLEEILNVKSDDDPVDIYHSIMDFEGVGAEAYIAQQQEQNPDNQYRYYNEKYYIETITEGERKAVLEKVSDPDAFFQEALGAEYPGLLIKAELNRSMDTLTFHLNREVYDANPFMGFSMLIVGAAFCDSIQAYNLVPPEERNARFVCLDENGDTLIDSDEMESAEDEPVQDSNIAKANYTLTDEVIVDNDQCTFTIKSIDPNGDWGFTLNVFCENKSEETMMFSWDKVSVMGYMVDPFWAAEVAGGKKSNEAIHFSYNDLDSIGISSVDDITFKLRVSYTDNWDKEPAVDEIFSVYPTGKSVQDIQYPERKSTANEQVLVDNDECTFVILSSGYEGADYQLHCYLENKTGHSIMFGTDEVSVNGYMADPFWGTSVAPGKRMYATIVFYESVLTENGISDVEDIEFALHVTNEDTWDQHFNEVFTYKPTN